MIDEHDSPPRLSAAEQAQWMAFNSVLVMLPAALDAQLQRDAGLSLFEYLVMAGLSEAPERTVRMSDLATAANGSLSRLSHTISRLERRGWVRRQPLPEDGRITTATLTDLGHQKVEQAAPGHVAAVRHLVFDTLDAEQLRSLGDASRAILTELCDPSAPFVCDRLRGRPPADTGTAR